MRQRMKNCLAIEVENINLNEVEDVAVTIKQRSSGAEFTYSGDEVHIVSDSELVVFVPKTDAMQLLNKSIKGQVMFTRPVGYPDASEVFVFTVDELLKEDGYGE